MAYGTRRRSVIFYTSPISIHAPEYWIKPIIPSIGNDSLLALMLKRTLLTPVTVWKCPRCQAITSAGTKGFGHLPGYASQIEPGQSLRWCIPRTTGQRIIRRIPATPFQMCLNGASHHPGMRLNTNIMTRHILWSSGSHEAVITTFCTPPITPGETCEH